MAKRLYSILVLVLLVAVIGGILLLKFQKPKPATEEKAIQPSFAEVALQPKNTEILSPDGKVVLTVKEEKSKSSLTETFSISKVGDTPVQIYSKTMPLGSSIAVPYNTFSPDDKYIFLKESSPSATGYYSLPTKGGDPVYFTDEFSARYPEFKVTDVTGWGGLGLIIINVDKAVGGQGPSFWFEVASGAFIRLSDRFN